MSALIAVQADLNQDWATGSAAAVVTVTPSVDTTNQDFLITCGAVGATAFTKALHFRVAIPTGASDISKAVYSHYQSTLGTDTGVRLMLVDKASTPVTRTDSYQRATARATREWTPDAMTVTPYDPVAGTGEPAYIYGAVEVMGGASQTAYIYPPIIYFLRGGGHRA